MFFNFSGSYDGLVGTMKHAVDFTEVAQGILAHSPKEDEDYVGTWEDAFLFDGYENGKYGFLTNAVSSVIARHGFEIRNLSHNVSISNGVKNNIICELKWKGQNCIPDRDLNGNPVVLGKTYPRLFLPKVIQDILDLEFGYDKELFGADRVELGIEKIS